MLNNERTIILYGKLFKVEAYELQTERADLTRLENMPREYNWVETIDDNNNTVWLLKSPYEEGFYFRLKQRLYNDEIEWFEAHDSELMSGRPDWWLNISEAKAAIEQAYRNILADNSV